MRLSLAKNVAFDVVNEKIMFGLLKAISNMYGKSSASNNVFLIRQFVSTKITEDNRIRHILVISQRGMLGMASIGDVVHAIINSDDDSKEDSDKEEEAIRLPIPNGLQASQRLRKE
ncbi:hypothetical protein Tco_0296809 [Tanacetum coccineum]